MTPRTADYTKGIDMPDWLGDLLNSDGFYLVVGALLAGVVGYGTNRLQAWQESNAMRIVLESMLALELNQINESPPPERLESYNYRFPMRLTALSHILDGRTLSYRRDRRKIELLLELHQVVNEYNDSVRVVNNALSGSTHQRDANLLTKMQSTHGRILALRSQVLKTIRQHVKQVEEQQQSTASTTS